MKWAAGCFLSAVLGGMFCLWFSGPTPRVGAFAEEPVAPGGPRFPGALQERARENDVRRDNDLRGLFNRDGLSPDEAIAVAVYEKDNKGVVNITTKSSSGFLLLDVSSEGTGSGSVIDHSGHVLTNFHVVEDAQQVGVTLYDGKNYDATLVGADPINDIAVLKINAPREVLFPIELGDSSS